MQRLLLICLPLLFAACGRQDDTPPPAASVAASAVSEPAPAAASMASAASAETIQAEEDPMPADLLKQFEWHTERIKRELASASPKQADNLYDEYVALLTAYNENRPSESGLLVKINDRESTVLDNFCSEQYWVEKAGKLEETEALKTLQRKMSAVGLEYWDVGECTAIVRPKADYYLKLFGTAVSPDTRRFLEIEARQDKELATNDAALSISWQELAERVMEWEDFLQRHPSSRLNRKAFDEYLFYQNILLFGLDNTPTYYGDDGTRLLAAADDGANGENGTYGRDYQVARQKIVKQRPDGDTAKLVVLTQTSNYDQAKKAVNEYRRKHFDSTLYSAEPEGL